MTNTATYEVVLPDGGLVYESEDWQLATDVAAQIGGATVVTVPTRQMWYGYRVQEVAA